MAHPSPSSQYSRIVLFIRLCEHLLFRDPKPEPTITVGGASAEGNGAVAVNKP